MSKRMRKRVWLGVFLSLFLLCAAGVQARRNVNLKTPVPSEKWIETHFAKGKLPPFSFVYGDKHSDTFIKKWRFERRRLEAAESGCGVQKYEVVYTEPGTGLCITCDVTGYTDFDAVEWVLHFSNKAAENSPQIRDVAASDVLLTAPRKEGFTVYTAQGSNHSRHDFQANVFEPVADSTYFFAPQGGRSSDTSGFPFFNIETASHQGVLLSVGWSGTWYSDFRLNGQGVLGVKAGMKDVDLYLKPGESIRTPLISMLFWNGTDRHDGQNKYRRFVLAHHTRKINGKMAPPPLCGGFEWGDPAPCNEYTCLTEELAIAMVQRYKQFALTPDVFWLDAGWYAGSGGPNYEGKNWYNTVGDWSVDKARFPNGFKPLSDYIHKAGAKFMVWFEPERVMEGTYLAKTYPGWMLRLPDYNVFLYDLGNPEACDFLCKYIGDFMEENGIDYYRQDFNMDPKPFWELKDKREGRKGISEIRHIEGLYRFWDYLLTRFPNLQIDNCASGGRRLDLETTSRSLPLWRTDYQYGEPNGYQNHTYNLNSFLPLHGTGLYHADAYNSRSSFSSAMVMNWEIFSNRGNLVEMKKVYDTYKWLRDYYLEDYYPLSGDGDLTGDDKCLAYQLNKQSDRSGVVFAFRRGVAAPEIQRVQLKGLQPDAEYLWKNEDSGEVSRKSGKELMDGVEIVIKNAPGAALFTYKAAVAE